jgi:hypothetical protein
MTSCSATAIIALTPVRAAAVNQLYAAAVTGPVLDALTGTDTNLNPRRIIFLEVLNFKRGKVDLEQHFR